MDIGIRYNQVFDAENRLSVVQIMNASVNCPAPDTEAESASVSATTRFYYDGQGKQVKRLDPDTSYTVYFFGMDEVRVGSNGIQSGESIYYPAGGAMRVNGVLKFILSDQLGSTSVMTDDSGVEQGRMGYYPFGKMRYSSGSLSTDRLYTGQQLVAGIGLYNYKARYYDPGLGRFISADTVTPGGAQGLNRYSMVMNNPINFSDPTGHMESECNGQRDECGGSSLAEELANYGVVLSGEWSDQNSSAAELAIFITGYSLTKTRNLHETPAEAFKQVFNTSSEPLVLNWNPNCYYCRTPEQIKTCSNFGEGCQASGGVTLGSHLIEFASLSPNVPGFWNGVGNIVHELGHSFNLQHPVADNVSLNTFTDKQNKILKNGVLRPDNSGYDIWRFHPDGGPQEMFADMFVAHIFNAWNDSNEGGYRDSAIIWMDQFIYATTVR